MSKKWRRKKEKEEEKKVGMRKKKSTCLLVANIDHQPALGTGSKQGHECLLSNKKRRSLCDTRRNIDLEKIPLVASFFVVIFKEKEEYFTSNVSKNVCTRVVRSSFEHMSGSVTRIGMNLCFS